MDELPCFRRVRQGELPMELPRTSQVLTDIMAGLTFFTRIPLPATGSDRNLADALWSAPLAGALIGLAAGILLLLALAFGLPSAAAAAIALGGAILLTGALHEDGAADFADGLGGGATPDERLRTMRDSRIGSYGTLALILSILARWSALTALATFGEAGTILLALAGAHAASRAVLPAFAERVPPASVVGLSAGIGPIEPTTVNLALGLGALLLLFSGLAFTLVSILLLAAMFFLFERLCRQMLGGQTGDVLGALQQASEI